VNSVSYTNGGFGVLFVKNTQEVLVWKDSSYSTIFSDYTFRKIRDFDQNLAAKPITSKGVFEYSDPKGVTWIVASYPFLRPGLSNDPSSPDNILVILVFAQRSLAQASLDSLNANIHSTTNQIVMSTIIIIACTVGATLLLVFFVIGYITRPFEAMRRISEEIMKISAEDDDMKDYRGVLRKAYFNLTRTDEVGILASEYYYIVCLLHNKKMDREVNRYPPNPFYIPSLNAGTGYNITWTDFVAAFEGSSSVFLASNAGSPQLFSDANLSVDIDMDFLGSLSRNRMIETRAFSSILPAPVSIENTVGVSRDPTKYMLIPSEMAKVGWLTSLKSQLYLLSALLLTGIIITMIVTVVSLSKQGVTWMSSSTADIDNNQVLNMQALGFAKSVYVKVMHLLLLEITSS